MKKISAKQQRILDYISEFSLEHGYPPSVREICAEMELPLDRARPPQKAAGGRLPRAD